MVGVEKRERERDNVTTNFMVIDAERNAAKTEGN